GALSHHAAGTRVEGRAAARCAFCSLGGRCPSEPCL
ncbi:uncharacterized protein METZ01_LOCUS435063, partial [marine metagenome]